MCGSATYPVVSPTDPAHAGPVTSSTMEITALNVTVTDAVTGALLFQTTTANQNPRGQTCSFSLDGANVSLYAIVTPVGR